MAALATEPRAASLRDLYDAAKRACAHWQDGPAAREEMRKQCSEVPPHLREELIRHFETSYR